MNTDHYYAIGSTHVVCQDYARSGKTADGKAYAIVCDGCSSSPDTDVGARIIGLKAEKFVKKYSRIPDGMLLAYNVREKVEDLGLSPEAADATLIIALEGEDDRITIAGWGDGAVVSTTATGVCELDEFEYDPNYPFYLSYLADPERLKVWDDLNLQLTRTTSLAEGNGDYNPEVKRAPTQGWKTERYMFDGRILFVVTDGLSSFQDTETMTMVDSLIIASELTEVKVPKGKFTTKRARRLLRNFKRDGIVNTDDLGVAGIIKPVER